MHSEPNINLELRTLSTWHNNQQVDGGHYEAEAENRFSTGQSLGSFFEEFSGTEDRGPSD